MKNIFKTLAVIAAVASVASCDLSEYNPNEYGEGMVIASTSSIQLALNTFHTGLTNQTLYGSDFGEADFVMASTLDARFTAGYSADNLTSFGSWDELRDINYFLQMMDSESCCVSGSEKDSYLAQAYFYRAEWYFNMLKKFGDLPWYDHVITAATGDEFKDRDSRDEIIAMINKDLDFAIENITVTSPDGTGLTKYVAAFLKMRANLYEASFRKYNGVTASVTGKAFSNYTIESLYREAIDAAEFIMDSGNFQLVSSYRDLFTSKTLLTDEVILGAATSGSVLLNQNTYFNYSNQKSFVRPFINTFLMKDGSAYTSKSGYATETFDKEFVNRDPRLAMIVRTPGYKYNGSKVVPAIDDDSAPLGYQIIKFCVDASPDGANDQKGNSNSNCLPNMRYAEVLLAYAEAKAELGELTDADWTKTVGAIRSRAGITGGLTAKPTSVDSYLQQNFYPGVTDAAILEIRRERACELCLECSRLDDLLRWGCGNLLAELPWTGINIPATDTPVDIDGDGAADYIFSTGGTVDGSVPSVDVSGKNTLQVVSNGSVKQLKYVISSSNRNWASDGHLNLCPIPSLTITNYRDHGYNITQNIGY